MTHPEPLLPEFLKLYPFQPATAYWRAVEIEHVLAYPFPGGKGLDLGCGDSKLTRLICDRVGRRDWVGLDMDPYEADMARQSGLYHSVHVATAAAVPEPDQSFDFVFSNSVLEHVSDIDGALREVSRLLKPQGVALFTVPGDQFKECLKGPLLPGVDRERYLEEFDRRVAHLRYWSAEDWRRELVRHGMVIERVTRYLTREQVQRWELLSRMTGGLLYGLLGSVKRPIEIQKAMGVRQQKLSLPAPLRELLSGAIAFQVPARNLPVSEEQPCGCLMILARKSGAAN
ncbi:MAG: class I SAM-dependent methyltransferase [Oligoflexia bacterium]|nr:class I SAM-dependent methyltransferase [Oligoflexia bacterium]